MKWNEIKVHWVQQSYRDLIDKARLIGAQDNIHSLLDFTEINCYPRFVPIEFALVECERGSLTETATNCHFVSQQRGEWLAIRTHGWPIIEGLASYERFHWPKLYLFKGFVAIPGVICRPLI